VKSLPGTDPAAITSGSGNRLVMSGAELPCHSRIDHVKLAIVNDSPAPL